MNPVPLLRNRPFRIAFGRSVNDITTVHQTYGEVPDGERVALFGASGFLEIAVNGRSAAEMLGVKRGFEIHIYTD